MRDIMKVSDKDLKKYPQPMDFAQPDEVMIMDVNLDKDAQAYMKERLKEEEIEKKEKDSKKKNPDEPEPDALGKFGDTFEVLKEKTCYYSVMMT